MATSANKKELIVSVVLVIVRRSEVTAGPHGTAAVGLSLKTLCAFLLGRYLHPEAWFIDRILGVTMVTVGSRNGSCELLFGDGDVEYTLEGGPGVPDDLWRVVGIPHEVANELLGMWAKPSGLKDDRNEG